MVEKVQSLMSNGDISEAFSICKNALLENALPKNELEELALLGIQCSISSIVLESFYDHYEEHEDGTGEMIWAEEQADIVHIIKTQIAELERFIPYGGKKKFAFFRDKVYGFVEQHYLSMLDKYVENISDVETHERDTKYFLGHNCLVVVIIDAFTELGVEVQLKDGCSLVYPIQRVKSIRAKKMIAQHDRIVAMIQELAVDFPYFIYEDVKKVLNLYVLLSHIVRDAVNVFQNDEPIDYNLICRCRKMLVNILCDMLNCKIVSNSQTALAYCDVNDRNAAYKEIAELESQIRETEPGYTHPAYATLAPKKSGGCYVATAVYGSYDCPQVWTLRRYRDLYLSKTTLGRLFIRLYYTISPKLVNWFGETKWFKRLWKTRLDRMVTNLQKKGVPSSPYQDQSW